MGAEVLSVCSEVVPISEVQLFIAYKITGDNCE